MHFHPLLTAFFVFFIDELFKSAVQQRSLIFIEYTPGAAGVMKIIVGCALLPPFLIHFYFMQTMINRSGELVTIAILHA
jgi:hypothetical protein